MAKWSHLATDLRVNLVKFLQHKTNIDSHSFGWFVNLMYAMGANNRFNEQIRRHSSNKLDNKRVITANPITRSSLSRVHCTAIIVIVQHANVHFMLGHGLGIYLASEH